MNYFIYDENGIKQTILQNTTSIQWKPRYYESGKCEIHVRPTEENVKYLKKWNRIVCQERNEILFISSVERNDSLNNEEDMIVNGYMNNLDMRINSSVRKIKNIEADLLELVNVNKRGLDINVQKASGIDVSLKNARETSFDKLRETFEDYCEEFNLGFREIVKNNKLNCLEIYQGEIKQRARFSDQIGNILSQKYIEDVSEYANYAYVYGEGEGSERKSVIVDLRKNNEPIIEVYIDARDIQSTYKDSSGNEHTYTDAQYQELLIERGKSKLNELEKDAFVYQFDLDINNQISKLGVDYDLGDIVPILSTKYNLFVYARIIGIDFIEEVNKGTKVSLIVKIENVEGVSL